MIRLEPPLTTRCLWAAISSRFAFNSASACQGAGKTMCARLRPVLGVLLLAAKLFTRFLGRAPRGIRQRGLSNRWPTVRVCWWSRGSPRVDWRKVVCGLAGHLGKDCRLPCLAGCLLALRTGSAAAVVIEAESRRPSWTRQFRSGLRICATSRSTPQPFRRPRKRHLRAMIATARLTAGRLRVRPSIGATAGVGTCRLGDYSPQACVRHVRLPASWPLARPSAPAPLGGGSPRTYALRRAEPLAALRSQGATVQQPVYKGLER